MNSKNSKTSDPHNLLINLSDKKKNLKRSDKYVSLSNLSIYYISKSQEITWSGNLHAAIVYVIARLFG